MDLESDLEKTKYRNWVRGVLAYKYLKCGIGEFADYVVTIEHQRIVSTYGNTCNQCIYKNLKPAHVMVKEPSSRKSVCRWGQSRCNCLYQKKIPCPNKVCDAILEDILGSHGSTPPSPNWNNTDVQKWCSVPWEIAKCFINAPGYSNKSSATDIDGPGLLHLFINNKRFHTHISCAITDSDIFSLTLERRNKIFHSPSMELKECELNECIDGIIAILEDKKELKSRPEAKQAVCNIQQLKDQHFIISTHDEKAACRSAMEAIEKESSRLLLTIDQAKNEIKAKEEEALQNIDEKSHNTVCEAIDKLEARNDRKIESMKRSIETLAERVKHIEPENSIIYKHLQEIYTALNSLKVARDKNAEKLKYIDQKLALQRDLIIRYETFYTNTSVSPLKTNEDDISIAEVYTEPLMIEEKREANTARKEMTQGETKMLCNRKGKSSNYTEDTEEDSKVNTVTKEMTRTEYKVLYSRQGQTSNDSIEPSLTERDLQSQKQKK